LNLVEKKKGLKEKGGIAEGLKAKGKKRGKKG